MSLSIVGVHHVAIIASDYGVSKDFYMRILGGVKVGEVFREERNSWKLDLVFADGVQVELFSFDDDDLPERPSYPEALGLRHLAFRVENLENAQRVLENHGVPTESIRLDEHTNKRFLFFKDPDGLPLELYED